MAFAVTATLPRLAPVWDSLREALRASLTRQSFHTALVFRNCFDWRGGGDRACSKLWGGMEDVPRRLEVWSLSEGWAKNEQRRITHVSPTEAVVAVSLLARKRSRAEAELTITEHYATYSVTAPPSAGHWP